LWFIRVLFVYNLAYPAIRWCVEHRKVRYIFFSVAFLMWIGTMGFIVIEGEGLLFFSLGILIQKNGFSIETPHKWLNPVPWGIAFFALSVLKTMLAFLGHEIAGDSIFTILTLLHKAVVLSGLIFCWFGLNWIVKGSMSRSWFVWLTSFSFIIYAMHTPLVAFAINPIMDIFGSLPSPDLTTFILLPVFIIAFCIATGALIRRIWPTVYGFLTGGRGF
jgi:fucose 4-O-acetylase-like acetyltransferase